MTLTHKEIAKHIRKRIKHAKIKASVRMTVDCGVNVIRIDVKEYGLNFTNEETIRIYQIAIASKLTGSRGSDIQPMLDMYKKNGLERDKFVFEYHAK